MVKIKQSDMSMSINQSRQNIVSICIDYLCIFTDNLRCNLSNLSVFNQNISMENIVFSIGHCIQGTTLDQDLVH